MMIGAQIAVGSFASMGMGFFWFSESGFGRPWWRYQFPNRPYGDCVMKGMPKPVCHPLLATLVAMLLQSSLLMLLVYTVRDVFPPWIPTMAQPFLCIAFLSVIVACCSLPHHVYAMKDINLYLICTGFDTAQLVVSYLAIYIMNNFLQ